MQIMKLSILLLVKSQNGQNDIFDMINFAKTLIKAFTGIIQIFLTDFLVNITIQSDENLR